MFSPEVHLLIFEEKRKELQREVVRHQLIKSATLRRPDNRELVQRMTGWFGFQMVKWGVKPQHHNRDQRQTAVTRGS